MIAGDLVHVHERYSKYTPRQTGIVFAVDEKFYRHSGNISKFVSRVHVLWSDGTSSAEPEQYVEIISGVSL